MAIEIRETFQLAAPVEGVWRFLLDPRVVAAACPARRSTRWSTSARSWQRPGQAGRTSHELQGPRAVRRGRRGRPLGGVARGGTRDRRRHGEGRLASRLRRCAMARPRWSCEASVDLTGRVVQVGRGMIQGVSQELFRQFVARVQANLESPEGEPAAAAVARASEPSPHPAARAARALGGDRALLPAAARPAGRLTGRRRPCDIRAFPQRSTEALVHATLSRRLRRRRHDDRRDRRRRARAASSSARRRRRRTTRASATWSRSTKRSTYWSDKLAQGRPRRSCASAETAIYTGTACSTR